MNASCPAPAQLHALVAGELSENDRHAVEQHLAACPGCRAELEATRAAVQALARPVKLSATPEELAARILAQLDQAAVVPLRPRRRAWLAATASAVAAAAALLFVLAPRGGFQPRGGGERPLERAGIDLYAPLAPDATPLAPGAHLSARVAFTAVYRNPERSAPIYFMAFAIDESGAVHWLYPGYVDPASDPAAIRLAYATVETPLAESVQLEGVSAGRLRVVVLKSTEPLTVHAIESLAPADLELEALRRRFPRALLRETDVVIDAD